MNANDLIPFPKAPLTATNRLMDEAGKKTIRQWEVSMTLATTKPVIEPLSPVQQLPTNQFLMKEQSPEKLKQLAGLKNNSWSPPLLRESLQDTRQMPGTRTGSKLKGYERLYYGVNQRALIKEDKKILKEIAQNKRSGPLIVLASESGSPIPAVDTHTLPGRATCTLPGL